jgi:hypothetical protein
MDKDSVPDRYVANDYAFPFQPTDSMGMPNEPCMGMTLRDWFAGQALAGLMFRADGPEQRREIASMCWVLADAMLAARKEPNQ